MGLRKGKKKDKQTPPSPGLPLPPLPGMPLPPPNAMPLPATPAPATLPEAPTPAPLPAAPSPLPAAPMPPSENPPPAAATASSSSEENKYGELWAKRSDKPLQQIFGHIDRLSKKDTGSLLDRYADRFGHSLDREIVVLRKKDREAKLSEIRDAPTVELIEEDEESLESQLAAIEDELRSLRPEYQAAKASGDGEILAQLRPILEGLMSERKSIKAMIQGEQPSAPTVASEAPAENNEEDMFVTFVGIVDDLLGSDLPEEVVSQFINSDEFGIYQEVAGDPDSASDDLRAQFVSIVDAQLGNMSEESVNTFVASPEFEIYSSVATHYQA